MIFEKAKLRIGVGGITVAVFLTCLVYAFSYRIVPAVDARAYDKIALSIVAGNGFREDSLQKPLVFDRSIQRAGPAYEYFLASIYTLFGHSYEAVWIIQSFLHAATALLLFWLCQEMFAERGSEVGLVTMAIFGFHPDLIENASMLLTETLFLFFSTSIFYAFLRFTKDRSWFWAMLLGAFLAVGFLTRPTVALIGIIFSWYFIKNRLWAPLAVCVLVGGAIVAPWTYRNYVVYHQFIPTTLIGSYNIWLGNTTVANGGQLSSDLNPWNDYVEKYGFVSVATVASGHFKDFVWAHPAQFASLTATRVVRFLSLARPMGFWFYQTGTSQLIFIACSAFAIAVLFILGTAGLVLLARSNIPTAKYLVFAAASVPLPLIFTVVQSRYRFPLYPFLAIGAGYAVQYLRHNRPFYKNKILLGTVGSFALVTVFDIAKSSAIIVERLKQFI